MRRGQLIWGVILLLLGSLMLANQMGIRLPNGTSLTELFWPLLLMLGGAWILFGVFSRGKLETETASIDLQGAKSAKVRINHGAGELKLHGGASANELMRGAFVGGLESKTQLDGGQLNAKLEPKHDAAFPFNNAFKLDWEMAFNADIPLAFDLNLGANKSTLDLRDLTVTHLDLDTGASETEIFLPARGRFVVDIDCGAASLVVHVPEGLAARIRSTVALGDFSANPARFPYNGNYYQSPDYDSAPNAVEIKIDAGAASVKIR